MVRGLLGLDVGLGEFGLVWGGVGDRGVWVVFGWGSFGLGWGIEAFGLDGWMDGWMDGWIVDSE